MPVLIPIQDYHTLKDISVIQELSYRQSQNRLKDVIDKNLNKKSLIFKKSNKWFIHRSLIKDFKRKRFPIEYKLFITIASRNKFEQEYWKFFIHQLNKKLKKIETSTRIKYVIEPTNKNNFHLHFMTTFDKMRRLKSIIDEDDITNSTNDMNTKIKYVFEVKGLHKYFRKQNKPVLLR